MWNVSKIRNWYRLEVIIFVMIGVGFLFQSSCVCPPATTAEFFGAKPTKPVTFRSDEYVVCLLQGEESPASLADRFLGDRKKSWVIEDANEGIPFEKGRKIVIPLKEENKGGLTADGYQVVPILAYHRFAEDCRSPLCMPASIFDQQMKYLKDNGYRAISMSRLLGFLRYRHAIPKRSVVITLDDGYRSAYDIAYPILKKYGFTATLLIYTNFVGVSRGSITWDQLREMKANGFEVGSQTISHCDLTKEREEEDDKAYIERIRRELLVSKQIIDKKLGQDTIHLAFPYGRYNMRVLDICDHVGYKMAFSVKRGGNPFFGDLLSLRRDQILKRDMETFVTRAGGFHRFSIK